VAAACRSAGGVPAGPRGLGKARRIGKFGAACRRRRRVRNGRGRPVLHEPAPCLSHRQDLHAAGASREAPADVGCSRLWRSDRRERLHDGAASASCMLDDERGMTAMLRLAAGGNCRAVRTGLRALAPAIVFLAAVMLVVLCLPSLAAAQANRTTLRLGTSVTVPLGERFWGDVAAIGGTIEV